jgi:hypothetical protein
VQGGWWGAGEGSAAEWRLLNGWEEGVVAGLGRLDEGWERVRILRNFLGQFS